MCNLFLPLLLPQSLLLLLLPLLLLLLLLVLLLLYCVCACPCDHQQICNEMVFGFMCYSSGGGNKGGYNKGKHRATVR